jgi:ABC-2 type transport system permease protein
MLSSLFCKTLRDQRWSLLGWSIGLVALSFYLLYVYPFMNRAGELLKVLDNLPPVIKNLIGKNNFMASPEGFLNLQPFSMLGPLLFIIFAIAKGIDATAGEEERGTLDLLLANPLQRWQVIAEKFLAQALALFILGFVFWAGLAAGTRLFSIAVNWLRLAEVIFSCFLLGLIFLTLSLALGCLSGKRKLSLGISSGFAFITYLINAYAPMVEVLRPYRRFSPFYYYNGNTVLINGFDFSHVLVMAGLVVIFLAAALFFFSRRNLSS